MKLFVLVAALTATEASAKPARHSRLPERKDAAIEANCGDKDASAHWFFLGAPGGNPAGPAGKRVLAALFDAFDDVLPSDPTCLHVDILEMDSLNARYRVFGKQGPKQSIVGFHNNSLGAEKTVFVVPQPGQGLDVVILHEVLHALSHRFSAEASHRRLSHMIEGATEYITRTVAEVSFGIPSAEFRTGYGTYVRFYDALMKRLGADGPQLLSEAYFSGGYDAFERQVDKRLGVSLRAAARALQEDDLADAISQISH